MFDDVAFAIPSYKRAGRVSTLHMLECYGVPKEQIFIFVQTEQDKEKYEKEYKDRANVVYIPANNCAGNRNNAFRHLEGKYKYVLLMDDDNKSICNMVKGGKYNYCTKNIRLSDPESCRQFEEIINRHKGYIDSGATIVGLYASNPRNLTTSKSLAPKIGLIRGTYMFFGMDRPYFNEDMPFADDYEICARIIAEGKDALIDFYSVISTASMNDTKDGQDAGGCAEVYSAGVKECLAVQRKFIIDPYSSFLGYRLTGKGNNRYYAIWVKNA